MALGGPTLPGLCHFSSYSRCEVAFGVCRPHRRKVNSVSPQALRGKTPGFSYGTVMETVPTFMMLAPD
jgi:hypothetical protein